MDNLEVKILDRDFFKLKNNLGIKAISFVDEPAINSNFKYFNSHENQGKNLDFKFSLNEERRIVSGFAMIADLPILRVEDNETFYVQFTKDAIEELRDTYVRAGLQNSTNVMHDSLSKNEGVYMIESFLIDSTRGIMPPLGYELPKGMEKITQGSWFVSYKIDNEQLWEQIKNGEIKLKGFSIEGLLPFIPVSSSNFSKNIEGLEALEQVLEKYIFKK
jgi:hypothetical protein